jgi:hypothetical protein
LSCASAGSASIDSANENVLIIARKLRQVAAGWLRRIGSTSQFLWISYEARRRHASISYAAPFFPAGGKETTVPQAADTVFEIGLVLAFHLALALAVSIRLV